MLVGVARTSTGCKPQPNYGHATFTNVAFWNNWIRQTINKREKSIHCFEPFIISEIDNQSTHYLSFKLFASSVIQLTLRDDHLNNEQKLILQCKSVRIYFNL